jgi:hypothetical protein
MLKRNFFTCLLVSAYISLHAQNAGNALHFDGSNDNVTTSVPTLFTNTNTSNFTIEAWVYPQGNTLSRVLYSQHNASNLVTFTLSANRQVYLFVVANGNTYGKLTYSSLPVNQWTHVALTWTASSRTTKIYFNGVDQNGTTSVGTTSTGSNGVMTLGSRSDAGGGQFFTGSLDELRIWNYVRNNCEILSNKNTSLAGTENGLVSLYKFNEGSAGENNSSAITLVNSVASAANGTLVNFALDGSSSNWITSGASINQQGAQTGLTVNQSVSICSGESYTFPDGTTQNNITAAVTHTSSFTSFLQCDSSVVTNISVKPTYSAAENVQLCAGSSYTFPDGTTQNNITAAVTHTSSFTSFLQCDSSIVTNISIKPTYSQVVNVRLCAGESYTFPNGTTQSNITATVIHTSSFTSSLQCDSSIVTNISIKPTYSRVVNVQLCAGGNYTFPDGTTHNNVTAAVTHTSSFTSSLQCDSSIVTNISIKPTYSIEENVQLCAGGSYTFPDGTTQNNITGPFTYVSGLSSHSSCDSTITTHIQVTTVNTSVTQSGVLLSATGTGNYQWINCSTSQAIAGANAQTYTATATGSYAVQVSIGNCVETSACLSISTVGLNEANLSNLSIYPNPNNGKFMVTLPNAEQSVELKIIDVNGKLVMNEFYNQSSNIAVEFNAPTGLYILLIRLQTGEQTAFHIIKQ